MANYPKCPICGATGNVGSDMPNCACIYGSFESWSPAQLACALGYRINLVGEPSGVGAYFGNHRKPYSHSKAHAVLSRLAKIKGINRLSPPKAPKALRNGAEQ